MKYPSRIFKKSAKYFVWQLLLAFLALYLITTCSNKKNNVIDINPVSKDKKNLIIGFSQMNHTNPWRIAETNDIKNEAIKRGFELISTDADSLAEKQIEDVSYLISRKVDYIILAPILYYQIRLAVMAAKKAGIPLIVIDRMVDAKPGKDFLTFIGSNFYVEGMRIAEWLAKHTNYQANIIELRGRDGSSPAIDRGLGFRNVIKNYPKMEIVHSECANFERLEGQKVMEDIIIKLGRSFNAVYAHNDEMAIGAIQALKAAGLKPGVDVLVVSIDGEKDALKAILAGELGATVECTPRFAKKIFDVIEMHRQGKPIPPKIINEDRLFDITNAMEFIDEAF